MSQFERLHRITHLIQARLPAFWRASFTNRGAGQPPFA